MENFRIHWVNREISTMICIAIFLNFLLGCQAGQKETINPNACETTTSMELFNAEDWTSPYHFDEPNERFELPNRLKEISGLGISEDERFLLAVQDEEGKLFFIDRENGKVEREVEFWKDGDYEGVEGLGDRIFVLKSNGNLYEISKLEEEKPFVRKFETPLDRDFDLEGLGYDPVKNCLLLACKAKAGNGPEFQRKKAIYAFDLIHNTIGEQPTLCISLEDVHQFLGTDPVVKELDKLKEFFGSEDQLGFSPSGIAVHPISGNWYITSAVGDLLMVLQPGGKILHIEQLKSKLHKQAEGIAFTKDGTLYIANEGKGDKAMIYGYEYRP